MKHIFSSVFLLLVCVFLHAQTYISTVDSLIKQAIDESKFPGAVLCVVHGDKIEYLNAYGYRQVFPDTLPMLENVQFDLASLSKCVGTGMSVMALVEQGLLDINAPITDYLPQYQPYQFMTGKKGNKLGRLDRDQKVVDFLTHTSGLPAYASYKELLKEEPEASLARRKELLLDYMATCPRLAPAGTEFRYSCLNFITLQYVIEKITGLRLDEFAEKYVFTPLGMKNTCYYPYGHRPHRGVIVAPTEIIANNPDADGMANAGISEHVDATPVPSILHLDKSGKMWGRQESCYEAIVHDPLAREINAGVSGNAGVFSTAEDLAKLAIWMINPDHARGPFDSATLRTMLTVPQCYEQFGRLLAWDSDSDYSGCKGSETSSEVACHTGYTGTSLVIDMKKQVAVILLTNRAHPYDKGAVGALRRAVADAVFSQY